MCKKAFCKYRTIRRFAALAALLLVFTLLSACKAPAPSESKEPDSSSPEAEKEVYRAYYHGGAGGQELYEVRIAFWQDEGTAPEKDEANGLVYNGLRYEMTGSGPYYEEYIQKRVPENGKLWEASGEDPELFLGYLESRSGDAPLDQRAFFSQMVLYSPNVTPWGSHIFKRELDTFLFSLYEDCGYSLRFDPLAQSQPPEAPSYTEIEFPLEPERELYSAVYPWQEDGKSQDYEIRFSFWRAENASVETREDGLVWDGLMYEWSGSGPWFESLAVKAPPTGKVWFDPDNTLMKTCFLEGTGSLKRHEMICLRWGQKQGAAVFSLAFSQGTSYTLSFTPVPPEN